jgi:TfoX/Sxy family transcriptional regulator of competence genes
MKKGKFILGFMVILEIFLIIVIINQEKSRSIYKERDGIGLTLKGKIIQIHSEGDFRLACLKVEKSNYIEYRKETAEFFIRVKDSLAVMVYPASNQSLKIGSEILVNYNYNHQIFELEKEDTINKQKIMFYPIGNYIKDSCIPE